MAGQRNERYAKSHESRINNHLIPFFGDTPLKKITAGLMQEYRIKRTQMALMAVSHRAALCTMKRSPCAWF